MTVPPAAIAAALERYFEDQDRSGLDEACALARQGTLDIAALLDWVQQYRAGREAKAQALRSLRAALQLPVIPGPVCRPQAF